MEEMSCDDCRVVESGTETVTVEEDGVMTKKTVNGVPQDIGKH